MSFYRVGFTKLLFLIIAITVAVIINAQQQYSFFNISNQFVNKSITAVLQDRNGFLWFGTRAGLHRFDGYEMKQLRYDIGSTNNLLSQSIEVLEHGKQDIIWIGTKTAGLSSYNLATGKITNYINTNKQANDFNSDYILSLCDTDSDKLLIGTWKGFEYFNKKTNQFIVVNSIWKTFDIKEDGNNGFWLGTNSGLRHFTKDLVNDNTYNFNIPNANITSITYDKNLNCLWLGTWNEGLIQFYVQTKQYKIYKYTPNNSNSISSNNTYRTFIDSKGTLWVGTWGGGLNCFNRATETFTKIDLSIPGLYTKDNDVILTIHEDASGLLWVGSDGTGAYKLNLNQKKFNNIGYKELGIKGSTHVTGLFVDKYKNFWFGAKGGPIQYLNPTGKLNTLDIAYLDPVATPNFSYEGRSFLQDGNYLWIATTRGLFRINTQKGKKITKEIFLPNANNPTAMVARKTTVLAKDSSGKIWIGTQENGLVSIIDYDKQGKPIFKNYPSKVGKKGFLQNERVSCLLVDSKNQLWVGTYKGLHIYNSKLDEFTTYIQNSDSKNSISSNIILSITEDKFGNIWIGTQLGLNKINVAKDGSLQVRRIINSDGLANDYIHAVAADKQGNIWASTNKGIARLSFINSNPYINIFDKRDGLLSNEFSENAFFKDDKGVFYFGGIEGITYFNPDSIVINKYHPPVYFTNLSINNKPVEFVENDSSNTILKEPFYYTKSIRLSYQENIVSIEFAALDFNAPDKNEYRYKLEGFNDDWVYTGNNRQVSFTNLNQGKYFLKIQASNSDKVWNESIDQLEIIILPPIWKTWWAYAIYVLIFIFLLWLTRYFSLKQIALRNQLVFSRLEAKKEKELSDFKERLFTNISHEFRTPLTLILGPLDDLLQRKKFEITVEKSLRLILKQSKRMLRMVNQLLDYQKAEAGSLKLSQEAGEIVSFCYDVFSVFVDEAQRRRMDYTFHAKEKYFSFNFDHNKLEIIIVNVLSNAFKFTPSGGKIAFEIEKLSNGDCQIKIADNGKGINQNDLDKIFDRFYRGVDSSVNAVSGTGIGLSFVKELVQLHGGTIIAQSDGINGSSFVINLPPLPTIENSFAINKDAVDILNKNNELTINADFMQENSMPETNEVELPIILVVDDEADIQQYVYDILSPSYKVITAANGKEGIEVALETIPDVIVSDIMMPEVDGIELCRTLKSHQSTSHIPIILLTALSDMAHHVQGIREGADVYLPKPFNSQLLLVHIHNLITSRNRLKDLYAKKILLGSTNFEVETFEEEFLSKVVKVVEDNISNSYFSSDELANLMFMSRSTFYRKLKAVTGISGNEFVRSARLNYAAKLLQSGKYSVSETAFEAGFNDIKYFRKRFQDHFGVSPSEYKK